MGLANRIIYKYYNGHYVPVRQDVADFVPLTLGGWKRSQSFDKQDHYKTRIYTRPSKSGLSKVPYKIVYTNLDNGDKTVLTNLRRAKPNKFNSKKCKRKGCPWRI